MDREVSESQMEIEHQRLFPFVREEKLFLPNYLRRKTYRDLKAKFQQGKQNRKHQGPTVGKPVCCSDDVNVTREEV